MRPRVLWSVVTVSYQLLPAARTATAAVLFDSGTRPWITTVLTSITWVTGSWGSECAELESRLRGPTLNAQIQLAGSWQLPALLSAGSALESR